MGFLRKYITYIVCSFLVLTVACTKPMILKNIESEKPGHFVYAGEPERKFFYDKSISDSLELKWIADTEGGYANTSVIIYDTLLFTGDLSGKIYAFGNSFGHLIGKEKFKGAISTALLHNTFRLFFLVNKFDEPYSVLYYYDYVSGKVLSETKIHGKCNNEFIMIDDGVLVLTEDGKLLKFNFVAFKEWEINTDALTSCNPAASGNIIVFGNMNGELIGVDLIQKQIIYRKKISSGFQGGVSIIQGFGFIGDMKGAIYKFDISNGEIIWKYDTGTRITTTPVSDGKRVYCGNLQGDIHCVNNADGKKLWVAVTKGVINAAPILFKNFMVQPDVNKKVHFIDIQSGEIIKSITFDRRVKMSPVFYDNTLYFGVDDSEIHAYKVIESE